MRPGRRTVGEAATGSSSVTADLFESSAPRAAPVLTALRTPGGVPPVFRPASAVRARHLWYAAVFPQLAADPRRAAVLQRLGRSAQCFTSLVSIESPNALLLEIKGSVKLFGTLHSLHADIDAAWQRLGFEARSATAPTSLAALWCARAGKPVRIEETGQLAGCLAELPVACTAWNAEWLQTLNSLGVTCLGDLLRLPRAGLARRLKPAAVLDIDMALGRQAAPRRAFVAQERFRERCDFEFEIETVGYLQKALEPLLERCAEFLRTRQAGVQTLELRLRHRALPTTQVLTGLASITGERRRLADVLEQQLKRLELVAPVRAMVLRSGALQPLSADSLDAFAGMRSSGRDTAPQLVERLRARLGEAAVYGVCPIAEHRPEAAWRRVQEFGLTAAVTVHCKAGAPDCGMPRPVWLLETPLPVSDALILEQGPERIESGWWDGKGVTRDYYIAREAQGGRWWVFQERRTRCWYLHGVFA